MARGAGPPRWAGAVRARAGACVARRRVAPDSAAAAAGVARRGVQVTSPQPCAGGGAEWPGRSITPVARATAPAAASAACHGCRASAPVHPAPAARWRGTVPVRRRSVPMRLPVRSSWRRHC